MTQPNPYFFDSTDFDILESIINEADAGSRETLLEILQDSITFMGAKGIYLTPGDVERILDITEDYTQTHFGTDHQYNLDFTQTPQDSFSGYYTESLLKQIHRIQSILSIDSLTTTSNLGPYVTDLAGDIVDLSEIDLDVIRLTLLRNQFNNPLA